MNHRGGSRALSPAMSSTSDSPTPWSFPPAASPRIRESTYLGSGAGRAPALADGLEHDRDADRSRVDRLAAALARVGGATAPCEHALRRLCALAGRDRRSRERVGAARAVAEPGLQLVDRRDERVEQGLVTQVGVAALLDAFDRGAKRGDHVVGARVGLAVQRAA